MHKFFMNAKTYCILFFIWVLWFLMTPPSETTESFCGASLRSQYNENFFDKIKFFIELNVSAKNFYETKIIHEELSKCRITLSEPVKLKSGHFLLVEMIIHRDNQNTWIMNFYHIKDIFGYKYKSNIFSYRYNKRKIENMDNFILSMYNYSEQEESFGVFKNTLLNNISNANRRNGFEFMHPKIWNATQCKNSEMMYGMDENTVLQSYPYKTKKYSEMSDEELQKIINQMKTFHPFYFICD